MKKTIAITSMYANPIHPGHIECLNLSREQADELWVIVNNDFQAELKRGTKSFQDETFRAQVVGALRAVDRVFISVDQDPSVCQSLEILILEAQAREDVDKVIFTKGGDRFANEIPEKKVCDKYGVIIVDGLGAKTHNSSDMIGRLKNQADAVKLAKAVEELPKKLLDGHYLEIGYRPWGVYFVLEDSPMYKVKKIIVNPGMRLSLQSHERRSEHWTVVSGTAAVDIRAPEFQEVEQIRIYTENQGCHIPATHLHRLSNIGTEPLVIVEVQCGNYTGEDDIKRYEDDF
jgi:cytidyltransferase-like protein